MWVSLGQRALLGGREGGISLSKILEVWCSPLLCFGKAWAMLTPRHEPPLHPHPPTCSAWRVALPGASNHSSPLIFKQHPFVPKLSPSLPRFFQSNHHPIPLSTHAHTFTLHERTHHTHAHTQPPVITHAHTTHTTHTTRKTHTPHTLHTHPLPDAWHPGVFLPAPAAPAVPPHRGLVPS